jgi:putative Mg2+ transporter-C (MgtC) family protein
MLSNAEIDLILRLIAAAVCGAALGWEREAKNKAAGLRTHMLVCLGAATFTTLGTEIGAGNNDPVRVIQGVATGIGFLGAGQIMHTRRGIEGLTTAAAIWLAGAVGVACGIGRYPVAVAAVVLGLATLAVVMHLEGKQKKPPAPPLESTTRPKQARAAE